MFDVPFYAGVVSNEVQEKIAAEIQNVLASKENDMRYGWGDRVLTTAKLTPNVLDELPELSKQIDEHVDQFKARFSIHGEASVAKSWVNVYKQHYFQNYHHHMPHDVVAIYYDKVPQNSGSLLLKSDAGGLIYSKLFAGRSSEMVAPTTGMIVMFPAFVEHCVTMHNSNEDRISVACNIDIKNKYD